MDNKDFNELVPDTTYDNATMSGTLLIINDKIREHYNDNGYEYTVQLKPPEFIYDNNVIKLEIHEYPKITVGNILYTIAEILNTAEIEQLIKKPIVVPVDYTSGKLRYYGEAAQFNSSQFSSQYSVEKTISVVTRLTHLLTNVYYSDIMTPLKLDFRINRDNNDSMSTYVLAYVYFIRKYHECVSEYPDFVEVAKTQFSVYGNWTFLNKTKAEHRNPDFLNMSLWDIVEYIC